MLQKIAKLSFTPVLFENVIMPAYDVINLNSAFRKKLTILSLIEKEDMTK